MVEILPIKILTDEDAPIFGSLNVALGKLERVGFPVASGIVVTPPHFKLRSVLEHFDFGTKEVFEQSLTLVKKEINQTPVPQILTNETGKHNLFLLDGEKIKSVKNLWLALLNLWLLEIKHRLFDKGFYPGITEGLEPKSVIFIKKMQSRGSAYFDSLQDDVEILVKMGKLNPNDWKKITEIVRKANKRLFIPHEYEWITDDGVKLVNIEQYTPVVIPESGVAQEFSKNGSGQVCSPQSRPGIIESKNCSVVKVFFDLSEGFSIEENIDGVYINSEKIFDLNKPMDSFENLVFKLVESAITFPNSPVFIKLADKSEGMGKVRGALRLLHQQNLFNPLVEAVTFARHKKGLNNIHIVVPFIRGVSELLGIKRELAAKKLIRKNSLQVWMEVAVPENIVNLENYLEAGLDGVVLNLDELISYLMGFDLQEQELAFYNNEVVASFAYKNEVEGIIKFLDDGVRLLHKSKISFIACGSLTLNPKILEFLVEKGVYGIVAEKYDAHSAKDLLYQTERRMILRKS